MKLEWKHEENCEDVRSWVSVCVISDIPVSPLGPIKTGSSGTWEIRTCATMFTQVWVQQSNTLKMGLWLWGLSLCSDGVTKRQGPWEASAPPVAVWADLSLWLKVKSQLTADPLMWYQSRGRCLLPALCLQTYCLDVLATPSPGHPSHNTSCKLFELIGQKLNRP